MDKQKSNDTNKVRKPHVPHNPVLNMGTTWNRRWTTYVAYEIRNATGSKRWLVS